MVGGCVRDQVLGLTPNDYDITTDCLPSETMRLFSDKGFSVIPVGLKHGTVAVLAAGETYEITTYRSDAGYADGRHPDAVHFLKDLRGDLERRDFTMNAMAYDPVAHRLVDLFDGRADMERRVVRAVGDPDARLGEDHLRMLRAVRYAARFDYAIEPQTLAAIRSQAEKIDRISKERVLAELIKMAAETGETFARALVLLKESGLLAQILPEIDCMDQFDHDPESHPEGGVWDHTLATLRQNPDRDAVVNLAILFHDVGKPPTFAREGERIRYLCHHQVGHDMLVDIARRLKMSGELKAAVQFAALNHMKFHELLEMSNSKLVRLIEHPHWSVLYRVAWCDDASRGRVDPEHWRRIDQRVADLHRKYLADRQLAEIRKVVNGPWVMAVKGIPPGPQLGAYIDRTVEWIINESVDLTDKDKIEAFLRELE